MNLQVASFVLTKSAERRNPTVLEAVATIQVGAMEAMEVAMDLATDQVVVMEVGSAQVVVTTKKRTPSATRSRTPLLALMQDASFAKTRDSAELLKRNVLLGVVALAMGLETADAFRTKAMGKHV